MRKAILKNITGFINKALKLDDEFIQRLAMLDQKIIRVSIHGFDFTFDIRILKIGIEMSESDSAKKADVEIDGAPLSLLRLLMAGSSETRYQVSGVSIEGDAQLAHQLAQLSGRLDIDWQEIVAKEIGDIPAHYLGEWFNGVNLWRQRSQRSFLAAISEYLREEARLLPTRVEVEHFVADVDNLRDAIVRVEDRLTNLNNRTN